MHYNEPTTWAAIIILLLLLLYSFIGQICANEHTFWCTVAESVREWIRTINAYYNRH